MMKMKKIINWLNVGHKMLITSMVFSLASIMIAANANAAKKDMVLVENRSGFVNIPDVGLIPFTNPDIAVHTTVDGSTSLADLSGTPQFGTTVYLPTELGGPFTFLRHVICLSVEGNTAIIWDQLDNNTGLGSEGDIVLQKIVSAKVGGDSFADIGLIRNVTTAPEHITSVPGNHCQQADASLLLSDGFTFSNTGVGLKLKDGVSP